MIITLLPYFLLIGGIVAILAWIWHKGAESEREK